MNHSMCSKIQSWQLQPSTTQKIVSESSYQTMVVLHSSEHGLPSRVKKTYTIQLVSKTGLRGLTRKAGNLNHAIRFIQTLVQEPAEFIASLDADMIPEKKWLRAMLPHLLLDSKMGVACPTQVSMNQMKPWGFPISLLICTFEDFLQFPRKRSNLPEPASFVAMFGHYPGYGRCCVEYWIRLRSTPPGTFRHWGLSNRLSYWGCLQFHVDDVEGLEDCLCGRITAIRIDAGEFSRPYKTIH